MSVKSLVTWTRSDTRQEAQVLQALVSQGHRVVELLAVPEAAFNRSRHSLQAVAVQSLSSSATRSPRTWQTVAGVVWT